MKWKSLSHVQLFATSWIYCPWNCPGQNTGVGSLSLLQGIFPTQGLNPGLLHCRRILYQLSQKGNPGTLEWVACPFSSVSSWPRNWTRVSCTAGGFFTNWAIREALKFWTLFWIFHFVNVLHPSFLTFDIISKPFICCWKKGASLVAQLVKNLPAMQKTQVLSLSQEDFLEKGVATHFSILAWRTPRTEHPVRL